MILVVKYTGALMLLLLLLLSFRGYSMETNRPTNQPTNGGNMGFTSITFVSNYLPELPILTLWYISMLLFLLLRLSLPRKTICDSCLLTTWPLYILLRNVSKSECSVGSFLHARFATPVDSEYRCQDAPHGYWRPGEHAERSRDGTHGGKVVRWNYGRDMKRRLPTKYPFRFTATNPYAPPEVPRRRDLDMKSHLALRPGR